jgi:3-methyladenine DNA glycosylase/8-oxoguanine DNA glycosylase
LPLRGAGGEPVAFRETLRSHGLAWLPPNSIDENARELTTTLPLEAGGARTLRIVEEPRGEITVTIDGAASAAVRPQLEHNVRAMFALDDDLSGFYASLADDAELAFARRGVGRLLRSPSAFEEVVRTICTTNCAWSATTRMLTALVAHLGERAPGAPADGAAGRSFPTAAAMADAGEAFYRDVVRAGYRGPYFRTLAARVADGSLDLEAWRAAPRTALSDEELETLLLELPGVGPYAAAHVMLLFGRSSRLVLDSWTRPTYARLAGKKKVADRTIVRRFKKYGENAGLAFWLLLWREHHESAGLP